MVPDFSLLDNSPLRPVIVKAMAHEADKRTVSVEQFEAEVDAVLGIQESGTVLKPKDLPGRAVAGNFDVFFRVNDQCGKSWRRYVSLEEWEEIPSEERKNYTPEGVAVVVRAKSRNARPLRFGVVLADRKTKNGKRFFDKISAAQHADDLPDGLELLAINGLRTEINNILAAIGGTPIRHTYWVRENADSIVVASMGDDSVPSSKPEAITAAIRPIIEID